MQTTTIILQIRNLYCILRLNLNIYYNTILSLSIKKKRTIHIQTTTTTKKHTNNSKQNKTNPSPTLLISVNCQTSKVESPANKT